MLKRVSVDIVVFMLVVTFCPNISTAKDPKEFKLGMMTSFSGPFASGFAR